MWREHDSGPTSTATPGGEPQVGPGWFKRYVRDDVPGAVVTVAIYPIGVTIRGEGGDEVDESSLELEQLIVCAFHPYTDGDVTKSSWSDHDYDSPLSDIDGRELHLTGVEQASREARRLLDAVWVPELILWNGVTPER